MNLENFAYSSQTMLRGEGGRVGTAGEAAESGGGGGRHGGRGGLCSSFRCFFKASSKPSPKTYSQLHFLRCSRSLLLDLVRIESSTFFFSNFEACKVQ